jgi:hypothetical protein
MGHDGHFLRHATQPLTKSSTRGPQAWGWAAATNALTRFAANALACLPLGKREDRALRKIVVIAAMWLGAALAGAAPALAGEMKPPQLSPVSVDWEAATAALLQIQPLATAATAETGAVQLLGPLNGAMAERFPGIADSSVPVLLPFDVAAYLRDRAGSDPKPLGSYLGGFSATGFFLAGPAGYSAVFSIRPADEAEFSDIKIKDPVFVEVAAGAFTYNVPAPVGVIESAVRPLIGEFPGLRRLIVESHLRYSFDRFGVTYVISIMCDEGPRRARRLTCKQADRIATRFLKALRITGGTPAPTHSDIAVSTIDRPEVMSPDFTYVATGKLLPGTGMEGRGGASDDTVYARIRFPIAQAPAYANSQSFMNWGDCDHTGRVPRKLGKKDAPYRCKLSSKPLIFNEAAAENYSYPWRDNFCEHRYFFVGQCPAGLGHQGQDIRPASCKLKNDGADRCTPYQDDIVAVRDGMILRAARQESLFLVVDSDTEFMRFRYMHMHPDHMDDDGMLSGRRVRESEWLAKVGNYNERDNGTTYHLHFEAQVWTRFGWLRVNPYMTLVAAYEHLIGARGTEIADPEGPKQAPETAGPATAADTTASVKKTEASVGRR